MNTRRVLAVAAGGASGFLGGTVAGFALASAYDEALFGWHDTIGPEIGFALMSGVACTFLGGALVALRFNPAGHRR